MDHLCHLYKTGCFLGWPSASFLQGQDWCSERNHSGYPMDLGSISRWNIEQHIHIFILLENWWRTKPVFFYWFPFTHNDAITCMIRVTTKLPNSHHNQVQNKCSKSNQGKQGYRRAGTFRGCQISRFLMSKGYKFPWFHIFTPINMEMSMRYLDLDLACFFSRNSSNIANLTKIRTLQKFPALWENRILNSTSSHSNSLNLVFWSFWYLKL